MRSDEFMKTLAIGLEKSIDEFYRQHMGFALIVFPFNDMATNYISNANRADMINALRESADRIERNAVIGVPQGSA